jgi:nucleoside triphosphate diphosphatase
LAGEALPKLVALMAHLRGPDGCPWDQAQDYESVKGLLLEEAYEVVDAVNQGDYEALEEELGDLLFQVVFYSRLAEENATFDIDRVIESVYQKLIRRHPHVFGEKRARTPEEALQSWTAVKEKENERNKADKGDKNNSLLGGMPPALPATLEAYELGLRASEAGFDWVKIEDLLEKIEEELQELRRELASDGEGTRQRLAEEVGDLLFTAANLARKVRSDPESALRAANKKFKGRFQALEAQVASRGKTVRECSLEQLEEIWGALKERERR